MSCRVRFYVYVYAYVYISCLPNLPGVQYGHQKYTVTCDGAPLYLKDSRGRWYVVV